MWKLTWCRRKSVSPRGGVSTLYVATPVYAHVCARLYAHVCAHGCARVIREIKLPFHNNVICLYHLYLIDTLKPINFYHVGLFLCFHVRKWRGIMWSVWWRDLITIVNCHLSEWVCGAFWFISKSFLNDWISTVHLRSYNNWD